MMGRQTFIAIRYDVVLSFLYTWTVLQAYIADAKHQNGLLVYIIVYGLFTLLVRSPIGALLMNVMSGLSLIWLFKLPVMEAAGSYFKFGTIFGMGSTLLVLCVQVVLANSLLIWGGAVLQYRNQYAWSIGIACVIAVVMTAMAWAV